MTTYIHFTQDLEAFFDGLNSIESDAANAFVGEGLFVYKYRNGFPIEETVANWGGRSYLFVEVDEKYVELIQENPLNDDPDFDEYMIPVSHFGKCEIWFD